MLVTIGTLRVNVRKQWSSYAQVIEVLHTSMCTIRILRTVPPFVTTHTFCASRDTWKEFSP